MGYYSFSLLLKMYLSMKHPVEKGIEMPNPRAGFWAKVVDVWWKVWSVIGRFLDFLAQAPKPPDNKDKKGGSGI